MDQIKHKIFDLSDPYIEYVLIFHTGYAVLGFVKFLM